MTPEIPAASAPAPQTLAGEASAARFGMLWQGQYEARGAPAAHGYAQNLYIRHFALLIGGTLLERFEYFFETDFADLLKASNTEPGQKNGPGISVTDAFVTFRALDASLKIDAGLMLPPGSHNALQSKATLLSWDYFLNTSRFAAAFRSTSNAYGRDAGAQLRGLVFDRRLEYRLGAFQGERLAPDPGPSPQVGSRNSLRVAGRLQLNLLDPETGYFYGGTYLGEKTVLSVGAAVDYQHHEHGSYRSLAADVFIDTGCVTGQVDLVHRNGGGLVAVPEQTALMGELGVRIPPAKVSAIVRAERSWQTGPSPGELDAAVGLAYWAFGHTSNLKAFYTRLIPNGPSAAYDQLNVQWQVFFY